MNALLVQPLTPLTYWGFQYAVGIVGKKASLPPLGLVTLAAQLPPSWNLRLIDVNVEPLTDADLEWADVLLLTGMLVHSRSMHQILARAKAAGVRTVVGGPAASSAPEEFPDADHVFGGEAEGRLQFLVRVLEAGEGPRVLDSGNSFGQLIKDRPQLALTPTPRYDLLKLKRYVSMSVQYSRGCPFTCEFCDIIELFGRNPRVKSPAQMLAELDALLELGWRGTVFFVDDNFIGKRKEVGEALLPEIARWQKERGRPFQFYTEASVDLATMPKLVDLMVDAGFNTVFLGIESPSPEALRETKKLQNLRLGLHESVERLTRAGLEVYAGFILGFDSDGPGIFEAQRSFIDGLPIAAAMIGLLTALPGTQLWKRLEREGRLHGVLGEDQFERPNFDTVMDERKLLAGYRELLASLYTPRAFYARVQKLVDEVGPGHRVPVRPADLVKLLRIVFHLGVLSPRRVRFWKLFARCLRRPHAFARAMALAVQGEHFIRYTKEEVLPRMDRALQTAPLRVPVPASIPG